jgi:hypothetical protein
VVIRLVLIGERFLVHGIAIPRIVQDLLDRVELVQSHVQVRPLVLLLTDDSDRLLGERVGHGFLRNGIRFFLIVRGPLQKFEEDATRFGRIRLVREEGPTQSLWVCLTRASISSATATPRSPSASELGVFVVVEQLLNGRDVHSILQLHVSQIGFVVDGHCILVHGIAIPSIIKELRDHVELVQSHQDGRLQALDVADSDRLLGE